MTNTSKVLVSLASGIALGAVLGILYAPDKGSLTRKKIKNKSKKLADEVKHTYDELRGNLRDKAKTLAKSEN